MLSGIIAGLLIDNADQLSICQGNGTAASERAVQGHLQCIGHVLNGFPVSNLESRVFSRHIDPESFRNDCIVERMDRTLNILDDLNRRGNGFCTVLFVIGFLFYPGNLTAFVDGNCNGNCLKGIYGYFHIRLKCLIR